MNTRNKSGFRLISENAPEKYVVSVISANDVAEATENFFSENFRGAVSVLREDSSDGFVIASPDGIAYFFKVLLNAIFGDSAVKIKISSDSDFLTLSTVWKQSRGISDADMKELSRVANLSGFGFEFSHEGALARADILLSIQALNYLQLYAVDVKSVHEAYVKVFFLI